jgi:ABC-type multidrug transport system fused ATPase/permease subunit
VDSTLALAGPAPSAAVPVWRVLAGYLRPHRVALLAGGLLSLVTGATGLALPLVARDLIGNLSHHGSVVRPLALLTALVLSNAAIGAFGGYVLQRTAESVVLTARRGLVARLLHLRVSAVDQSEPGDLMSRVTADTTLLREVTTSSLVGGVTGALTLVATVVLMGLMDPVLLGVKSGREAGPGVGRGDGGGPGADVRRGPNGQGLRRRTA